MSAPDPEFLECGSNRIAYRLRPGASPTLVFLSGYASNMEGTKALLFDEFAAQRGQALLRFDYSGTGSSEGKFSDGSLDLWLAEALGAIDHLTQGPLVVVGSSLGAWIGLHVARLRPQRVRAFVGIASAPDFPDWGLSDEQKQQFNREMPNFLDAADKLALLRAEIAIDCPVRLVHGDQDQQVPHDIALRTLDRLRSADVQLKLIKGGGHRLTEPNEVAAIFASVSEFLEPSA